MTAASCAAKWRSPSATNWRTTSARTSRASANSAASQIGTSIPAPQQLQLTIAVLDIRMNVECSPQFGQTETSS